MTQCIDRPQMQGYGLWGARLVVGVVVALVVVGSARGQYPYVAERTYPTPQYRVYELPEYTVIFVPRVQTYAPPAMPYSYAPYSVSTPSYNGYAAPPNYGYAPPSQYSVPSQNGVFNFIRTRNGAPSTRRLCPS